MIKKLSVLALAGCFALPTIAGAASNADLASKIDQLTQELAELRGQIEEQEETFEELDEKAEGWDLASRFQLSGDIRNRMDYHNADIASHYTATNVASGAADFILAGTAMGNADTLAAFGLTANSAIGDAVTPGTLLGNLSGLLGGTEANFIAQMTGAYLNAIVGGAGGVAAKLDSNGVQIIATATEQAAAAAYSQNMWYMFTDPGAGALLQGMGTQGALVSSLLGAMSNYENIAGLMKALPASSRKNIFDQMSAGAYAPVPTAEWENETSFTTRLRLNMRVKATENIEIKARAVAYKFWGNQSNPNGETEEYTGTHVTDANPYFLNSRSFDGTAGRQPGDNSIVLDRAFMNWNNIAGQPVWFSIGRRPTTDGPPAQLRQGATKRMATPINYMDYPFDGISLGYAYANLFGMQDIPGRIRFCYGRGFESGSQLDGGSDNMNDVDFGGLSWDVMKKGNRFINIQSFAALNIFNVPGDTAFPNPYEIAGNLAGLSEAQTGMDNDGFLNRQNMGNIYHTSAVYMDKVSDLNYFATLGWSHTDPTDSPDEMGISLLSDSWNEPESQDGYGVYVGMRYDLDDLGLKFGAEYNYGSEYWLAFTPGHDDMYSSKLQTRGSVYEVYGIWDLPSGESISKFGKAFMRLGYQHYEYDYTYSGMWLGTPTKIDDLEDDPFTGQFYAPIEDMDQIYLTLEAWF